MALTVEDGTGLAGAESYISVADADTYHSVRGQATWTGADGLKEEALRRATLFIDARYGPRFSGVRYRGRDQALMWPRAGAEDIEGWGIDHDEVPLEIARATAEAALRELVEPGFLSPDVTISSAGQVIEKTVGPLTLKFAEGTATDRTRPLVQIIDDILAPLLRGLGGGFGGVPIVRA
jgi:hypothetical protein